MKGHAVLAATLLAGTVSAQSSTASPTTADTPASITSAAGSAYTDPLIQSLWSEAASLISTYYPSSSITNVASLTWPSEVVIGSTTYTLTSGATTLSTSPSPTIESSSTPTLAASESTSTTSANDRGTQNNNSNHTDKRLGIALGVGIGSVAVAVLVFLIWLLHRRKKRTGTFTRHRHASISNSEIETWKAPSSHSSAQFPDRYTTLEAPRPPMPPMRTHPAYARRWTDQDEIRTAEYSGEESNPFYTPYESYAELAAETSRQTSLHELHGESSMQMLSDRRPPSLITAAALAAVRPSTPYTPALMREAMSPVSPISQVGDGQHAGFWRHSQDGVGSFDRQLSDVHASADASLHHRSSSSNPFLSEEDDVLDTPPSIPARSPNRRSSPVVHYPSGDELSTFDFGLAESRRRWAAEELADGGDGWQEQGHTSRRESTVGRHEMA